MKTKEVRVGGVYLTSALGFLPARVEVVRAYSAVMPSGKPTTLWRVRRPGAGGFEYARLLHASQLEPSPQPGDG